MKFILCFIFCAASSLVSAATYVAAGLTAAQVQAAIDLATAPGDIVELPEGSGTWTTTVSWTAPAGSILRGAGTSATGGGDLTVITDGITNGNQLLNITVPSTGLFRMTGITFQSGSSVVEKNGGTIAISGPGGTTTANVRIDHCHINFSNVTANNKAIRLGPGIRGVLDLCILDFNGGVAIYPYNGRGTVGNYEWTQPTAFGTADYFFVEDNIVNGAGDFAQTRVFDGNDGAKMVIRFNTLTDSCLGEHHGTGHSNDDRGPRSTEYYGNSATSTRADPLAPNNAATDMQAGTALVWGNSWNDAFKTLYKFDVIRKDTGTYAQLLTPSGWGYAGPTARATGTVNVTGTAVTWVSGDTFDTAWPGGIIYVAGMTTQAISGQQPPPGPGGGIASVGSTTSVTLTNGGQSGAPLTGAAFTVGSPWDGNTTGHSGYPCLDQPARGAGDLLTGFFPSKINDRTGTIAYPEQAYEPIYIWNNVGSIRPGWGTTAVSNFATEDRVMLNRDYYLPASGIQTSPTSPFNGTVGTGWGTLANRPTTCTAGVAYWATDQGSWNNTSSNPYGVQQNGADGVLYKATATNTWTLYYEPYTYPHPLRNINQVDAPVFSPVAGTFTTPQSVTITSATSGATIRYTTNGVDPTATTGTIYLSPVSISTNTTLKAIAYDGVLLDSNVTSGSYLFTGAGDGNVIGTTTVQTTLTLP